MFDNCCTFSIVNNIDLLYNTFSSNTEIHGLTNVAKSIAAGYLKCLPDGINLAYYVPQTPNNLISLGYIEKSGGLYLAHGGLLTVLFPVDGTYLTASSNMNPSLVYPVQFTDGSIFANDSSPNSMTTALVKGLELSIAIKDSKQVITQTKQHYAFEAVDEEIANAVRIQHERMAHPGLDAMKTASKLGCFGDFTIEDLKLYETFIHPCNDCLRGKWKSSIHTLPQTLPNVPTRPGEVIVMDVNKLSVPSVEGFTHRLVIIDVYSSHLTVVGMRSKYDYQILEVLKDTIKLVFTAHDWKIGSAICDAEGCFVALQVELSGLGIFPVYVPPGFHARMVERYIQTMDTRNNSLLQGLPFIVPSKYLLFSSIYSCLCLNLIPNKRTCRLSGRDKGASPRDIITKFSLPKFRGLKVLFGDRCPIEDGPYKRNQFRKEHSYTLQSTSKASNATLIGIDQTLMKYLFLTDNGKVLSRGEFGPAPGSFPPNWKSKPELIDKIDRVKLVTKNLFLPLTDTIDDEDADDDDLILLTEEPTIYTTNDNHEPSESNVLGAEVSSEPASVIIDSTAVDPATDHTDDGNTHDPSEPLLTTNLDPDSWEITHLSYWYYTPFQEKINGPWIQGAKYFATHWKGFVRGIDGMYDKTLQELINLKFSSNELSKLPSQATYERNNGLASGSMNVIRPTFFPKKPKMKYTTGSKKITRKLNQSLANSALSKFYSCLLKSEDVIVQKSILVPEKYNKAFDRLFEIMEVVNTDTPILANASLFYDPIDKPKPLRFVSRLIKKRSKTNTAPIREADSSSQPETIALSCILGKNKNLVLTAVKEILDDESFDGDFLEIIKSSATCGVHSLHSAVKYSVTMAGAAVNIEMEKMSRLNVFTEVMKHLIELGAVVMDAVSVFKVKTNAIDGQPEKMTYRLAVNGAQQPEETYSETYASTTKQSFKSLGMAAFYAWATKEGLLHLVHCSDLDISGAFLHALYKSTTDTKLYMKLPDKLPGTEVNGLHKLAGKFVKLNKALYGLPESNMLFEKERNIIILEAGYTPTITDPSIFVRKDAKDKTILSILFTTVDDIQTISTYPPHWEELKRRMTMRFGELTVNDVSVQHCGVTHEPKTDGSFTATQSGYIKKFCQELGVNKLSNPFSSSPSTVDLFSDSEDTIPVNIKFYQRLIGTLIYTLLTRHDVRKEVIFMAGKSAAPTVGDLIKVTRIFRYLNYTAEDGPVYSSNEGATLYGYTDASWANHVDLRSHAGYFICIGQHSAPAISHSSKIKSCVATSSMEAEYVALCELTKLIVVCRRYLEELSFTQTSPTVIFEDNEAAIKLATSPGIGTKSKHILLKYHYTKKAVEDKEIIIKYIDTTLQRADCLTKEQTKPSFVNSVPILLNHNRSNNNSLSTNNKKGNRE